MTPRKTTDRETKSLNPHGFHPPQTSVRERIDQLETKESHAECKQWLKETMATRWPQKLPQPFVGFDDNEEAFVLVWESDARCNTLQVNAGTKIGSYCPWPRENTDEDPKDLNLETKAAWIFLRNVMTAGTG